MAESGRSIVSVLVVKLVRPPPPGFATWEDFEHSLPPERWGSAFACVDPSGVGPRLLFKRVPEGKVVKNRIHLDVIADAALEDEVERLETLGARVRNWAEEDGGLWCVMHDPEGNEFCVMPSER